MLLFLNSFFVTFWYKDFFLCSSCHAWEISSNKSKQTNNYHHTKMIQISKSLHWAIGVEHFYEIWTPVLIYKVFSGWNKLRMSEYKWHRQVLRIFWNEFWFNLFCEPMSVVDFGFWGHHYSIIEILIYRI